MNQEKDYPDYKLVWDKINLLLNDGLLEDAMIEIEKLYQQVTVEQNHPQIVKALIHMESIQIQKDSEGLKSAIGRLEKTLPNIQEPGRSVLFSLLGKYYHEMANLWHPNYSQRTDIAGEEQDSLDLDTWSKSSLLKKSQYFIHQSLKNDLSKTESLSNYESILNIGEDSVFLPTLFDFLVHHALELYKEGSFGLLEFQSTYRIEDLLKPVDEFLELRVDSFSAWHVFQTILNYHKDTNKDKLFMLTNLIRLRSVYDAYQTTQTAMDLYLKALDEYFKSQNRSPYSTYILCDRLEIMHEIAMVENESNLEDQKINFQYTQIDSFADQILKLNPDSFLSLKISEIKNVLRRKELSVKLESVVTIDQPFKCLVTYRNVFSHKFRLYKSENSDCRDFQPVWSEADIKILYKTKPFKEWNETWPQSSDFKKHRVELKLDGLKAGYYLLTSDSLVDTEFHSRILLFQVSDLSAVTLQNTNVEKKFFILNRVTGAPIKGATVQFYSYNNGRMHNGDPCFSVHTIKSNEDGSVIVKKPNYHKYKVSFKKDVLWGIDWFYDHGKQQDVDYTQAHFFTDRSIYRPGQIVHFKVLYTKYNSKNNFPKIVANEKLEIVFRNANYQEIGRQHVRTNEFGTASGSFVIPIGGLKGAYSIQTVNGGTGIQVEEYKRPNFEVKLDSSFGKVKLGDEVQVKGAVISYSGVPVAHSKIQFKVYFSVYWDFFNIFRGSKMFFPPARRILLTSGSAESLLDGTFSFQFLASKSDDLKHGIQYFEIEVDAVDPNGETQSTSSAFSLSNQSVFIHTELKDWMILDSLQQSKVIINNIQGQPVLSNVQVQIYELKTPDQHLKARVWEKPDVFKYSLTQHQNWFPRDVYDNEDQLEGMEIGGKIFESEFTQVKEFNLNLKEILKNRKNVKCVITANRGTKDESVYIKHFSVFSKGENLNSIKPYAFTLAPTLNQGDKLIVGLTGPNTKLHYYTQFSSRDSRKSEWKFLRDQSVLEYPVLDQEAGHVFWSGFTILDNRMYPFNISVEVPWKNKNIEINTVTFRDRMLPGSQEIWSFSLNSVVKEDTGFEMLASMYDASLDQILPFAWNHSFWPDFYAATHISSSNFGSEYLALQSEQGSILSWRNGLSRTHYSLPDLAQNYSDFRMLKSHAAGVADRSAAPMASESAVEAFAENEQIKNHDGIEETNKVKKEEVPTRTNLNETVFFYPHLKSDNTGKVEFQFKMNEALTRWKLQLFAHSKDMKTGYKSLEVITSKPVQIKPFYPRFLRQGDQMELRATVSNLSETSIIGTAKLEILNASNLQNISDQFNIKQSNDQVQIQIGQSETLVWKLKVPEEMTNAVILRYSVVSGQHKDGEEKSVTVVSNRKLLTQTLAMHVPAKSTKEYNFTGINNAFAPGAKPHNFTIEFSSNPVWYAIQTLPYLSDYPHECSEQLMSQIFANSIGSHIIEKMPRVKMVLQRLLEDGQQLSPLLKNQELKSALIAETPWVLEAESESEQIRRVALLMDYNLMNQQVKSSINKLKQRQNSDGSFSWFPGTWPDRTITQHIVSQIAHLQKLGVIDKGEGDLQSIVLKASKFLDQSIQEDYNRIEKLVKEGKAKWEDQHISALQVQYLYATSYYPDWFSKIKSTAAVKFWMEQMNVYWRKMNIYDQAMCALVFHRSKNQTNSLLIIESLRQRSIQHAELGMYWKIPRSYYWNQLPIETQAMLIEAFYEITKDVKSCDQMKLWLLKNKQTQHWGTTKATSLAVYAILQYATDWTSESQETKISLNNQVLVPKDQLAGSLYFKEKFESSQLKKELAKIKAVNPNPHASWGAAYVQYWQDLDQIKDDFGSGLSISQELFKKVIIDQKEKLIPIKGKEKLLKGDLVTVRCVIKSDRPMEYVHLKLMRASGLELIGQLSGYEWKSGLGYYKSPGDLSTDFFISFLPSGTFVFEYELRAAFTGSFSNGVSTIQCMYAPEFNANSKGISLNID
ncbi:MAG: hypothetical protein IPM48_11695 [Saprospiraceae bacterium]|nr:hypothetical protein [Saprospiraceae bacterium]